MRFSILAFDTGEEIASLDAETSAHALIAYLRIEGVIGDDELSVGEVQHHLGPVGTANLAAVNADGVGVVVTPKIE